MIMITIMVTSSITMNILIYYYYVITELSPRYDIVQQGSGYGGYEARMPGSANKWKRVLRVLSGSDRK